MAGIVRALAPLSGGRRAAAKGEETDRHNGHGKRDKGKQRQKKVGIKSGVEDSRPGRVEPVSLRSGLTQGAGLRSGRRPQSRPPEQDLPEPFPVPLKNLKHWNAPRSGTCPGQSGAIRAPVGREDTTLTWRCSR